MVLYECHVKGGDDSSDDWFSHHVDAEGEACYSPNMPQEWSFCLATNAWAWVCIKRCRRIALNETILKLKFSDTSLCC